MFETDSPMQEGHSAFSLGILLRALGSDTPVNSV